MPSQQFATTRDLGLRSLLCNPVGQVGCHPWCTYQVWLRRGLAAQVLLERALYKTLGKSIPKYPTRYIPGRGLGDSQLLHWRLPPITHLKCMVKRFLVPRQPLSTREGAASFSSFRRRCRTLGNAGVGAALSATCGEVTLAVPQYVSSNHNLNNKTLISR